MRLSYTSIVQDRPDRRATEAMAAIEVCPEKGRRGRPDHRDLLDKLAHLELESQVRLVRLLCNFKLPIYDMT